MAKATSIIGTGLRGASLALLALSLGCPPPPGECVTDEDCPGDEVCRELQESDERVCVQLFTPSDGGPEERDPVVIETLTADDDVVAAGGTTTLRWTARHASSCVLNEGIGSVEESGEREVTIEDTTQFTLSCQGQDGPALAHVTVAVALDVLTLALDAEEANVGATLTLSWTTLGASACTASAPGLASYAVPSGELAEGSTTFTATSSGDATLTCEGEPADVTESVPFEVARIASFTATPSTTTAGGTVTLAWVGENVTGCAVDGAPEPAAGESEVEVTVTETAGYTLRCDGYGGVEIEASVTVTVE